MTDHSSGSGQQRTVAELLAQYGGGGGGGGSRRRRRAEDNDGGSAESTANGLTSSALDTASSGTGSHSGAHGAPDGFGSDTSARLGLDSPGSRGYGTADPYRSDPLFPDTAPPPAPPVPEQRWASGGGYTQSVDPLTGQPISAGISAGISTGISTDSATGAGTISRGVADPPTEQLPRYPGSGRAGTDQEQLSGPLTGPITGPITGPMTRTGNTSSATARDDAPVEIDGGPPTGHVSRADLFGEDEDDPKSASRIRHLPAGLGGADESEAEVPPGNWFVMVVQWVIGAVAGALLWVGFSYLWLNFPVIALVAAVVVTAALVLLVRAIRRSDDLQTTMLAVLVGLVVTISPAVLLLATR